MSKKKIVFIGAGSQVFTRNLTRDLLTFPALSDSTIALVDVDKENLALAKAAVEKIIELGKYSAAVIATSDRAEVLEGADGVVTTIAYGGMEAVKADIGIPESYNVSINIGDTRGPSGIFRFLRTWNPMRDILMIFKSTVRTLYSLITRIPWPCFAGLCSLSPGSGPRGFVIRFREPPRCSPAGLAPT
jgi:alpha-galactosidase/6-phospho-beta-glucosidase family protein